MEDKPETAKGKPVEIVQELPEVAVKDKIIYNKEDQCFYIGKEA